MSDILVITGPVNQAQLKQPELSPGTETIYVGSGGGTGSNDMFAAVSTWLGGMHLRDRLEMEFDSVDRIGVIWFSAGHGGVRAILETTQPEDVVAWLCLDGLYAGWNYRANWATKLAEAAMGARTTLLATASTSTPGQYADSKSAWKVVMDYFQLESTSQAKQTAVELGLPQPDDAYQDGAMLVCGYNEINHFQQVPAMRDGMANWWNLVRKAQPVEPTTPAEEPVSSSSSKVAIVVVGIVVAAFAYLTLHRKQ